MISVRQIEIRALQALERLEKGMFSEDSLIELKRELSDPCKVARRIAGHCNAARGETVIWIVGVDEKKGIVEWNAPDFAEYMPQVWSYFQCDPPEFNAVSLEFSGKHCMALGFYSARPPYLVKNPAFGKEPGHVIESEIPWRDGTKVRTARRDEVMRLLMDYTLSPEIEVFEGEVFEVPLNPNDKKPPDGYVTLAVYLSFYLMPRSNDPIIVPHHRIQAKFMDVEGKVSSDICQFSFQSRESALRSIHNMLHRSRTPQIIVHPDSADSVKDTGSELIIYRPAHVQCYARTDFRADMWISANQFKAELIFLSGPDQVSFAVRHNSIKKKKKPGT
jgi:hypothetical protein